MGSTPVRGSDGEAALVGAAAADLDLDEVGRVAVAGLPDVPSDRNGSATYRRHVGGLMVTRALAAAVEEARRA
jgi:carbon-monoxide dehydrogenase medium subunit